MAYRKPDPFGVVLVLVLTAITLAIVLAVRL